MYTSDIYIYVLCISKCPEATICSYEWINMLYFVAEINRESEPYTHQMSYSFIAVRFVYTVCIRSRNQNMRSQFTYHIHNT